MVKDRKVYDKAYRLKNKDKIKAYNQTYNGIRRNRIAVWKQWGIIIDDYQHYYDTIYFPATHCETCHVEFCKESRKSNTKNLDHDHSIKDRPNVRNILCHACNSSSNRLEMYKTNTSGHANIFKTQYNTYQVRIIIRGNKTNKTFKTLNDAINFRNEIKNNM